MDKQELHDELLISVKQINRQIDEAHHLAEQMQCPPEQIRSRDGVYLLNPLLTAKVQALAAIVSLGVNDPPPTRGDLIQRVATRPV